MANARIRCAIYTRKSSEEGLDQSFNSLEAQREACSSFILSQKHEGWIALNTHYDDGGFSGGTMERPALEKLLRDIEAGKVDTVVVYKVDRLTRSLGDFSKIIEVFDSHKVSFVSVTQQFNTTTSMGRLTLNVLLSFAQFEREVTGERIRDKIAASKKKGMWMGGFVPLGYDCVDRRLVVNEAEAKKVREIFTQYLRLRCVTRLKKLLDDRQIYSKTRKASNGIERQAARFSRGALYHLLNNRIYIGEIKHRRDAYPGQHERIIPRQLWDSVSALLSKNNRGQRRVRQTASQSLLAGKLFDDTGSRLTPTHSTKKSKRYRYYTSQAVINDSQSTNPIRRLPAHAIENAVRNMIHKFLLNPGKELSKIRSAIVRDGLAEKCKSLARNWSAAEGRKRNESIREIVWRVVVGKSELTAEIDCTTLLPTLSQLGPSPKNAIVAPLLKLTEAFHVIQRGNETHIVCPEGALPHSESPIPSLVSAVGRAYCWYDLILNGRRSTSEIAKEFAVSASYIRRLLRCTNVSPRVITAILAGNHSPTLTLNRLLDLPSSWPEQEAKIIGWARPSM